VPAERPYPRFRPDLVVRRVFEGGEAAWTIHDPMRSTYFRHDEMTHALCELLDGERGTTAVRAGMLERFPQYAFADEWIDELVEELRRGGFLEDTFRMNEMQRARAHEARRKFAPKSLKNVFNIEFGVVDPSAVFKVIYPYVRWIFAPAFVVCALIGFVVACGLVAQHGEALVGGLLTVFTLRDSGLAGLLLLWVILFGIVVAHEFGHGLACMRFGGQPRRMGFLLFYLMPGMFCDVSDIYFFDRRWHRAAVALAGGYIELLCFTAGTFVWVATPSDLLLHDLAFRVMLFSGTTGLVFNYNPLVKLDGYYVLMSWLDVPDLRERSFKYLGDQFRRHVLRLPATPERLTRHERRALTIYGTLALLYSSFYSVVVLLFMRRVLVGNFREAGFVAFAVLFFYSTRRLWGRLVGGARYLALEKGGFARRHVALAVGAAVLVLLVLVVPLPHRVRVEAVLAAADPSVVVAPAAGRVEAVRVSAGQVVPAGAVLAVVTPLDDRGAATLARAHGDALAALARRAVSTPWETGASGAATDAAVADARLARSEARLASAPGVEGFLSARAAGRVLDARPERWLGKSVVAGDSLLSLGRTDSLDVLLVAGEREVADLALGAAADVRLYADPGRHVRVRLASIDGMPDGGAAGAVVASSVGSLADPDRPAQRFLARARIANPDGALRPGMSGRASVAAAPLNLLQRAARFYARIVRADFWL
jgi:putative peptide zinc metalloprotease protein